MPGSNYSKRSRQPSGNLNRCNDPGQQPPQSPIAATFNWNEGNASLAIVTDRPAVLKAHPSANIRMFFWWNDGGEITLKQGDITQQTPTTFTLTFDEAPAESDTIAIAGQDQNDLDLEAQGGFDKACGIYAADTGGPLQSIMLKVPPV